MKLVSGLTEFNEEKRKVSGWVGIGGCRLRGRRSGSGGGQGTEGSDNVLERTECGYSRRMQKGLATLETVYFEVQACAERRRSGKWEEPHEYLQIFIKLNLYVPLQR